MRILFLGDVMGRAGRRAIAERGVRAGDDERGALHAPPHPEARGDAARQGRLARAERSGEDDEVTRPQRVAERAAERFHLGRRGDLPLADERVEARHGETSRRGTRGPMRVTIS